MQIEPLGTRGKAPAESYSSPGSGLNRNPFRRLSASPQLGCLWLSFRKIANSSGPPDLSYTLLHVLSRSQRKRYNSLFAQSTVHFSTPAVRLQRTLCLSSDRSSSAVAVEILTTLYTLHCTTNPSDVGSLYHSTWMLRCSATIEVAQISSCLLSGVWPYKLLVLNQP